jgi:hypothetical protein
MKHEHSPVNIYGVVGTGGEGRGGVTNRFYETPRDGFALWGLHDHVVYKE